MNSKYTQYSEQDEEVPNNSSQNFDQNLATGDVKVEDLDHHSNQECTFPDYLEYNKPVFERTDMWSN